MSDVAERRWIGSFAHLAAGESVNTLVRLAAVVVVARRLGAERFGLASLGIVIGGYLAVLAHSGLDIGGTRAIAAHPDAAVAELRDVVGLRIRLGLAAFALTSVFVALLPTSTRTKLVIIGFAFTVVTSSLDIRWAFVGLQHTRSVALASSAGALWYLAGIVLFVRGPHALAMYVAVHLSADLVVAAWQWRASRRTIGPWRPGRSSRARLRELFLPSLAITVARAARTIMITMDVLLVKLFRPDADVGRYALAGRIVAVGISYIGIYYHAYFAAIAAQRGDRVAVVRLIQRARRRALVLGPPALAVMLLGAPIATRVLFGSTWDPTVGLLQAMLPSLLLLAMTGVYSQTLLALDAQWTLARIGVAAMVANVVTNLVLLPALGTVGASLATDVAETVMLCLTFVAARRVLATAFAPPVTSSVGVASDARE